MLAAAHTAKALRAPRDHYSDAMPAGVSAAEHKRAESGCVACRGQVQALATARTALGLASRALLATPLRCCHARQAAHVLYRAGQRAVRLHAYQLGKACRKTSREAEATVALPQELLTCEEQHDFVAIRRLHGISSSLQREESVRCTTGRLLSCWTAAERAVPLPLQRPRHQEVTR